MRLTSALCAGVLLLAPASPAAAHSLLLESSPAPGSTVAAPAQLMVRFNNRIEKALSRLRLVD
ncbi:MAG: copper resistance protein CopC, partial [candidate division NC10 bacterium]